MFTSTLFMRDNLYAFCIIMYIGSNGNCTPPCINGTCVSGNVCDCFEGWTGSICNQGNLYYFVVFSYMVFDFHITAICIPQCGHGTCIQPDECACDPGWTGLRCNIG